MLRPQDILLGLRLSQLEPGERLKLQELSVELGMSISAVHTSLGRCKKSSLLVPTRWGGHGQSSKRDRGRPPRRHARSPQGRLVELWLAPRPFQVTLQGLRTFHQQLGETAHRIVRVKKRR